jgi:hypothetical protein
VHLLIDRHKENESAFDISFPRIDELRHETLHNRHAAGLSPDSITCRNSDPGGSVAIDHPVWRFRRRIYLDDLPYRGRSDHRMHRAGHQAHCSRGIRLSAVTVLRHYHRRTFQRDIGFSGLSGVDACDSSSPVQPEAVRVGKVLAATSSGCNDVA